MANGNRKVFVTLSMDVKRELLKDIIFFTFVLAMLIVFLVLGK